MGIQFHFLVNHIGVVGIPIGLLVLGLGVVLGEKAVQRAALVVLVLAGLSVGVASWSGEMAEDQVKSIPGISEQQLDRHEAAAEVAQVIALVLAGIAGITVVAWHTSYRRLGIGLAGVLGVVATLALGYTAHQGGLIRHTELRGGTVSIAPSHD